MEDVEKTEVLKDFVRDGHLSIQIKTTGKIRASNAEDVEIIDAKDTVSIVGAVTNGQAFTIIQHLLRHNKNRTPKKFRESFYQEAIKAVSDALNSE